jgi:hypothetical protein
MSGAEPIAWLSTSARSLHPVPSIDDPEQLRMCAAEMRERADKAVYPETKQGLLRIAADYDVLAIRAEQRIAVLRRLAEGNDPSANADQPAADQNQIKPDAE